MESQLVQSGVFFLGIVCTIFVYFFVTMQSPKARSKVFNKEFMAQFNEEHQKAFGTDAPVMGFPDDGNGYYAQKLSYGDWYYFNNVQRAQYNFLETISVVIVMSFITYLSNPIWGLVNIWLVVVGRIFYSIGYIRSGPKGRIAGALIYDVGLLSSLIGGFYTVFALPW